MIRLATILMFCFLAIYSVVAMAITDSLETGNKSVVNSVSIIRMPELIACSCDSAYRCLSDQDYMELVAALKQERDPNCEACP